MKHFARFKQRNHVKPRQIRTLGELLKEDHVILLCYAADLLAWSLACCRLICVGMSSAYHLLATYTTKHCFLFTWNVTAQVTVVTGVRCIGQDNSVFVSIAFEVHSHLCLVAQSGTVEGAPKQISHIWNLG